MIPLPPSVRIYVAAAPADMRKSFDGLSALARNVVNQVLCDSAGQFVFIKVKDPAEFRVFRHNVLAGF